MRSTGYQTTGSVLDAQGMSPPMPHGSPLPPPPPGRPPAAPPDVPPTMPVVPTGAPPPFPGRPRGHTGLWVVLAVCAVVAAVVVGVAVINSGDSSTTQGVGTAEPTQDATSPAASTPTAEPAILQGPVDVLSSFSFAMSIAVAWEGEGLTMDLNGTFLSSGSQDCVAVFDYQGQTFTMRGTVIGDLAWYDDGVSGMVPTTPDDAELQWLLSSCPSSHEMWGEDFTEAPSGGVPTTVDGMSVLTYDVTASAEDWATLFGLPSGLEALSMTVWTSADGTWVAGMEAGIIGSADTFREYMGVPPDEITSDCTMMVSLHIIHPNDPTLVVTPPM